MDDRLPWNEREGIIYGCIIASISSLLIGGFNVYSNTGYSIDRFGEFVMNYLVIWPVIFIVAFTFASTVVERVAGMVVGRFAAPTDSVNAHIVMNIVVCVLMMSATISLVGGIVGETIVFLMGGPSVNVVELVANWTKIWPRNFCIAFWVEMLIAQPIARTVMVRMHAVNMKHDMAVTDST